LSELDRAVQLLDDAFATSGNLPWNWLNSTINNAQGYGQHDLSKRLRDSHRQIARQLGWRRSIPDKFVAKFIVSTLEFDLLRYPPIRLLLLRACFSAGISDLARTTLLSTLSRVYSSQEMSEDELCHEVEFREWRPSSMQAKTLCSVLLLPSAFAILGSSDNLPDISQSEPIPQLHPLTDYQSNVVEQMMEVASSRDRAMICMPTGAGKTRTAVESLLNVMPRLWQGGGILWIADRQELCEQAVQSFLYLSKFLAPRTPIYRFWGGKSPEIDYLSVGGSSMFRGVVVTSTQQMRNRLQSGDIDAVRVRDSCEAVVIDEAHRNLDWLAAFVDDLEQRSNPPAIFGLSATPSRRIRNETSQLSQIFEGRFITPIDEGSDDFAKAIEYLQSQGVLAERVDLSSSDLGIQFNSNYNSALTVMESFEVVTKFVQQMGLKSVLVFAESVQQSKDLSVMLTMAEFPSRHLDGNTPTMQRRRVIEEFREGSTQVLCNFDILTTGFDAPKTDGVVILRSTEDVNQPLITQMIGRGLRGEKFGGTKRCYFFIRGAA